MQNLTQPDAAGHDVILHDRDSIGRQQNVLLYGRTRIA